jgi:hypothetical protein
MNYRTTLLAGAAVLFAGQAMAADLTGALYTPNKGQLTSDTAIANSRTKIKFKAAGNKVTPAVDQTKLIETLEYGITDAFALSAGIANAFDDEGIYNNSHNFSYSLGAKYTTALCDKTTFQVAAHYDTMNPKSWYGHSYDRRWQKNIGADFKLGYDLGNGLGAYGIYGFDSDVDIDNRDFNQYFKFGLHKYTGQWALDGAFRYEFNTDGKNTHEWWFDAAADYYVAENVALGVYGSYYLDGSKYNEAFNGNRVRAEVDKAYEAGLHVKVAF